MTPEAVKLYAVIGEIRRGFNLLRSLAEYMHADTKINPSMRAVMEALINDALKTVPHIARQKNVSRQHIQVNMDALVAHQLVKAIRNPTHKRSPHYALTEEGKNTFSEIRKRENIALERLAKVIPQQSLEAAEQGIGVLNEHILQEIKKGEFNDPEG
jgi:DNA-binding MarR family transcriptional regulator